MKILRITFVVIALLILNSCARVVVPKGGEKDVAPPKLSKSLPPMNATNFKGKEIRIDFNEYITLEGALEKLIVSPPLKNKPEISSKLRSLYIKGLDSLRENTTYIFDFADAIRDFNEGNPISNFVFSFSTGEEIDTLTYYGKVFNAYTLEKEKNKYVALYSSKDKQVQTSQVPNYITRSDSLGRFFFHNIKSGEYSLITYEDNNNNLIYDLPTEGVGFANQTIVAKEKGDSLFKGDTLYFTSAKDSVMKLLEAKFISKNEIYLSFSLPISDSLQIIFLKPQIDNFLIQRNLTDTSSQINIYIANKEQLDSVNLEIKDKNFEEKQELVYSQKKKTTEEKKNFAFTLPNTTLPYYDSLRIEMPFPIEKNNLPLKAKIIFKEDSINIDFYESKENIKELVCGYDFLENTEYTLIIDSNSVQNLRGEANDSLSVSFTTDKKEDYSQFIVHIKNEELVENQIIYSLFDEKNKQVATFISSWQDSILTFNHLKEGKYKLRAIIDENKNGKWDGNNFVLHKQAEKILFFPKSIDIRKSWILEEEW
ncbi:MAG: Ig-like domain-containing protein [Bacteroidota bacterium]|nr:Ig-like domain-containing protein [Bacteroidota bacterium]